MNFMKKSLVSGIRDRVGALGKVKALLLLVSDLFAWLWRPISSFCSLVKSAKRLLEGLHLAQDFRTIAMEP